MVTGAVSFLFQKKHNVKHVSLCTIGYVLERKNEPTACCSVNIKLVPEKTGWNITLNTGLILHSVGHCTCILFSHVWQDSVGRLSQTGCRLTENAVSPWFNNMQGGVHTVSGFRQNRAPQDIFSYWCLRAGLISCGNWDCEWSERAFQMSPLCSQVPLFGLWSVLAGQGHPVQGARLDPQCWSGGGTGLEPVRLCLDPASSGGNFPDWAGLHVCQRHRCCTRWAKSALWRCSHLCCRCAGNEDFHM